MKRVIRYNTFETNSSSIHCLTVLKDIKIDDEVFNVKCKILPYTNDEINDPKEFKTINEKLRYLWTLRCKGQEHYVESEKIDEFTSMLKSIVPNVEFCEIEDPAYMEDFESGFDYDLMFNETFIKKWLSAGVGYFTERDSYGDYQVECCINKIRNYEFDETRETICWEG